jgi:Arc/MetJ-type ribon-helix-helix transcriptional regulator
MAEYPSMSVRLPEYTLNWLKDECKEYDLSKSEIVREALNLYYQNKYGFNS